MVARGVRIAVLALAALAASASIGQQSGPMPHIGFLQADAPDELFDAFRDGLRVLGYVDGRDVIIETRWGYGHFDRLPKLADDLVRAKVAVIVTASTPATLVAKQATSAIPIVFASAGDPVASGIVSSLAHPRGNITGL